MCTSIVLTLVSCVFGASGVSGVSPNEFTVVNWNVESTHVDPQLVALRLAEAERVGLWGLCGVGSNRWSKLLAEAAGENEANGFLAIRSRSANGRCLIVYDAGCFEPRTRLELGWEGEPWLKPATSLPPALVVRFRHHPSGLEFFFMVNCLEPAWAARQADKLHAWAARQTIPVIAVGTYWFQYGVGSRPVRCEGRQGFTKLTSDDVFEWLAPVNFVKTYDSEAQTIEDFVFVANAEGRLRGRAQVVVRPGDFSGPGPRLNHRPVKTTFKVLSPAAGDRARIESIARQVREIEAEIDRLEALVSQDP